MSILEQGLSNSKFFGKDGLTTWIGQVTTDKNWIGSSSDYGYRAKVRIQGFHPPTAEVSDDELPWTHFILPGTFGAGNALGGTSFNLQGGETVVGFFLDSPHNQQPISFGCLYTGGKIEEAYKAAGGSIIPYKNVNSKLTSEFNLFKWDDTIKFSAANMPTGSGKPANFGVSPGDQTADGKDNKQLKVDNQRIVCSIADKCKNTTGITGEISRVLRSFIEFTKGLKEFKDGFLDPVLNVIVDIPGLIFDAATIISGLFSQIMRSARKWLFKQINDQVKKLINFLIPDSLLKEIAIGKAMDAIFCAIEKIIKGLVGLISKYLFELIGKLVSFPICAAEQFVAGLINDVSELVQDAIGESLNVISGIIGGVGTFMGYMELALSYIQQGVNFLSCEENECSNKPYDWAINFGPVPKDVQNFQRTISVSQGINNLGKGASKSIDKWFGLTEQDEIDASIVDSYVGSCNPFNEYCGPPKVLIFGGGGVGAAANAVVNDFGQIVGVNIISFGNGYIGSPFVSFIDSCNNGSGATGTAIVEDGQVTNIVVTNPGEGYLSTGSGTSDETGIDVVGQLDGIDILNTGYGYSPNDTITSECGSFFVELDDEGRLIGASLIDFEYGCTEIPNLQINTDTGYGAIIRPIMKFAKAEEVPAVSQDKVIRVIDCVGAY